jgi:hypothetical protein
MIYRPFENTLIPIYFGWITLLYFIMKVSLLNLSLGLRHQTGFHIRRFPEDWLLAGTHDGLRGRRQRFKFDDWDRFKSFCDQSAGKAKYMTMAKRRIRWPDLY